MKIDGDTVDAKECISCGEMQPLSSYTKRKDMYDGHLNKCKSCRTKRQAEYAKVRPDIRRKAERNWRNKNPDKVKEMARKSRQINKAGYERRLLEFYERNPNARKVYHQNRRARLKSLPNTFTSEWADGLLSVYGGCVVTGSTENLHWDHFIPLSIGKGGTYSGNMVPLRADLNLKKSASNPIDFLLSEGVSYEHLYDILFILSWLNDMPVVDYIRYVYKCFEEKDVS